MRSGRAAADRAGALSAPLGALLLIRFTTRIDHFDWSYFVNVTNGQTCYIVTYMHRLITQLPLTLHPQECFNNKVSD